MPRRLLKIWRDRVYVDAEYECTCDQLGMCIECDVYIIWQDDKGGTETTLNSGGRCLPSHYMT